MYQIERFRRSHAGCEKALAPWLFWDPVGMLGLLK